MNNLSVPETVMLRGVKSSSTLWFTSAVRTSMTDSDLSPSAATKSREPVVSRSMEMGFSPAST
ncbi:MAG: hypothetical protein A4E30_00397 [Methanomassiliicoccales archaeon PtaB.Bin215]|nr:MAG: hypothetical protein A4E30_00397 [Methanomassiliicoccales archaeon PtaB.Bin215]